MRIFTLQQKIFVLLMFIGVAFLAVQTTTAAPNLEINYQGKLTNTANQAVPDGTYNMRFWLLTSDSIATTSAVWTEELTTTNRVQVTNGLFSVMLGSTSPLTSVDFNQTLYLGVEIGSTTTAPAWDSEMSPRKVLGTVPAAFEAKQFDGLATTSFLRADQDDTASGLLTLLGGASTTDIVISGTATTTNLVINGDNFTDLTGTGLVNTNGALSVATATLGLGLVESGTQGQIAFYAANGDVITGTSSLFIDTNGNIGIGTTSPTSALHIGGSGQLTLPALADPSTPALRFQGDNDTGIGHSGIDDQLSLVAGGINRVFITATNNIRTVNGGNATTPSIAIGNDPDTGIFLPAANVFAITTGGNERLRISSLGNIGIGTTTPQSRLTVVGASTLLDTALITLGSSTASNLTIAYAAAATSTIVDGNAFAWTIATSTDASPIIRIDTSGSGKPTTTIRGSLVVDDGAINYSADSGVTSIDNLELGNLSFDTDAGLVQWIDLPVATTSSGQVMGYSALLDNTPLISTYGITDGTGGLSNVAVGIGTTTPERLLSVAGDMRLTGAFWDSNNASGTLGMVLQSTAAGTQWVSTSSLNIAGSGGGGGGGAFTSSGGDTVLNTIGDFVGIGTSTPTAKLAVTGNAGQTEPLFRISSSTEAVLLELTSAGDFSVNNGAIYYDYVNNKTSIERLDLGAVKFEESAGWVSWIDVAASTSATAGDILAYSAQIDASNVLTLYSEEDGSGGVGQIVVAVGDAPASVMGNANIPTGSMIIDNGALCVDDGTDTCDDGSRTAGSIYAQGGAVTGIDLAEMYPTNDAELEAGELAMLDSENAVFVTTYDQSATTTNQDSFLGVISTAPGLVLGGFGSSTYSSELQVPVTLAGRVPVKVNFLGGDISVGDRIGFSSIAGIGMKATTSGMTVGIALEPYVATSSSASTTEGLIEVFVDSEYYYTPDQFVIDRNGNVAFGTTTDESYQVKIGGDVAATGFINISASSSKKDIEHINEERGGTLMEDLRGIELAEYRYKEEATSSPLRLGLIAEEAPSSVLSVDGKGVDLYKLTSLTLAGVQDIDERLLWIESEMSELFVPSTDADETTLWERIKELASSFVNGVLSVTGIKTDELCVGDVCVDEAVFLRMVEQAGSSADAGNSGGGNDTSPEPPLPDDTGTTTQEADTEPPSIIIQGADPVEIEIGGTYIDEGASATDTVDGDLTQSINVEGVVDTNTEGSYEITYTVTDSSGNTKTATRYVNVIPLPEPEPEVEEPTDEDPISEESGA